MACYQMSVICKNIVISEKKEDKTIHKEKID